MAFAVGMFLSRRWGVVLTAVAILVGFSRVYAGVHYPADIAGSALIAAIAVGTVALVCRTAPIARFAPIGVKPA
jgi:undecaprenyl-diphosphatase